MSIRKAIFLCIVLLTMTSTLIAKDEVSEELSRLSDKLNHSFFKTYFKSDESLLKAFLLAQQEDFESKGTDLFSSDMFSLMSISDYEINSVESKLYPFYQFEKEIKTKINTKENEELISLWREMFLNKLMQHMRYRSSLKPIFKFSLHSATSYNSNINRVNEEDLDAGAGVSTDEEDGQQLLHAHMSISPWVNNTEFSKKNSLSQNFNLMALHQFSHKENQIRIFDTETVYKRKLSGSLRQLGLAYRYQNFGLSGDEDSRSTETLFTAHRFRGDLTFQPVKLKGKLSSTRTKLGLSYTSRTQDDETDSANDAEELSFSISQNLVYKLGKTNAVGEIFLDYVNFETDDNKAGEYNFWRLRLQNTHQKKWSMFKYPTVFSEQIGWRMKGWDEVSLIDDEDLYWLQIKASTIIKEKLNAYLSLQQVWRSRQENIGLATEEDKSADQTIVTFGLTWRSF